MSDRYGESARRALDLAYELSGSQPDDPPEVRAADCARRTTTGHLLAGLRGCGDEIAAPVLADAGVAHPSPGTYRQHLPATPGLIEIILRAGAVADRYAAPEIIPVHLLIALAETADPALTTAGIPATDLLDRICTRYAYDGGFLHATTSPAKQALVDAAGYAAAAGTAEIGMEHVLLALAAVDDPVLARVLAPLDQNVPRASGDSVRLMSAPLRLAFGRALRLAADQPPEYAKRDRPPQITPVHLAASILELLATNGSPLLRAAGIDPVAALAELRAPRPAPGSAPAPVNWVQAARGRTTTGVGHAVRRLVSSQLQRIRMTELFARVEEADRSGSATAARRAFKLAEQVVLATDPDDPALPNRLVAAALASLTVAERLGDPDPLASAEWYAHLATKRLPDDSPYRPTAYSALAWALALREDLRDSVAGLPQALAAARRARHVTAEAVTAPSSPATGMAGEALRQALTALFNSARLTALATTAPYFADIAVEAAREAADSCPPEHPRRHACLSNLAFAHSVRAGLLRSGGADHRAAVEAIRQALAPLPDGSPGRLEVMATVGAVAIEAADELGTDPAKLVALCRQAVDDTEPGSRRHRTCLHNLATAQLRLALWAGTAAAFNDAIATARQLYDAGPAPSAASFSLLAKILLRRFDALGESTDLDECVLRLAQASKRAELTATDRIDLGTTAAAVYRARWAHLDEEQARTTALKILTNLANQLPEWHAATVDVRMQRALLLADDGAYDEAVRCARAAVATGVAGTADDIGRHTNLVSIHRRRHLAQHDPADLDDAVTVGRAGLDRLAGLRPDERRRCAPPLHFGLAQVFRARAALTSGPEADDDLRAAETHALAALGPPDSLTTGSLPTGSRTAGTPAAGLTAGLAVDAGALLGDVRMRLGDPTGAVSAYRVALAALPRYAWHGTFWEARADRLAGRTLGADAAAAALAAGDPATALELLERGRGLMWQQLLDVRNEQRRLREAHPALAGRLAALAAVLDTKPAFD